MPLLTGTTKKSKKISCNVFVDKLLFEEVSAYCRWAGISRPSEFIVQAIHYVLKNDKDWRKVYAHQPVQQDAVLSHEEGLRSRG